ncbi:MAG TPA: isoprenylcysteine carboxylmethyltransferase family protein [Candidatus Omnitrophota bacterium]|nr:isoprenylcysteine carboxylmethyltransferase family protein [Candidatus Omnitrophota bacterium]HPS36703.1 isoprenylcysteine carboxylmethyltransferase family protein [Candidatus Omnitrophota bacterium]
MKKILLPFLIIIGFLGPWAALFLNLRSEVPGGNFFSIFLFIHTIVRLWETFLTSREQEKLIIGQDWSLIVVTTVYVMFFYIVIFEFYLIAQSINWVLTCSGLFLYFIALRLKLWSMRILGKQWAIHALGDPRIQQRRLIKLGPYKHMRHPIYFATLVEQLSVLMIANVCYSCLFFISIVMPAYVVRMFAEEKNNEKIFGSPYRLYREETGMFFSLFPKKKKKS